MIFLPLYRAVAQSLSEGELPDFFSSATVAQLAAVLFVQNAAQLGDKKVVSAELERQLAQLIRIGNQANQTMPLAFQKLVGERFSPALFSAGLAQLGQLEISLLDDEHPVEAQRYLDDDGEWLFSFSSDYQAQVRPLQKVYLADYGRAVSATDPQERALREFLSAADESFNLQGYAGSGKTHLIQRFTELLEPSRTLLLAQTYGQLQALQNRAGGHFPALTFAQAAGQVLDSNLLSNSWRLKDKARMQQTYQVSHAQVVRWLNIPAIAHLFAEQVASVCVRTVASFCNTSAVTIDSVHLPAAIAAHLSALDLAALLATVQLYWSELIQPSEPAIRLPIRGYHRIKLLSLTDEILDQQYSHIIVDEAHDIPTPMLQILDRSPQAVITLSDELQNLNGLAPRRNGLIRQRSITQSVRLGKQVEEVINPLIQAHPGSVKELFAGRADHCTHLQHYSGWQIPSQGTTVIVADEFDLFAWFQRLTHASVSFKLARSTFKDFMIFAQDCIELYLHGTRPRHGLIFRYASWPALSAALSSNPSFMAIERMLEKGYSLQDFQNAVDRYMRKGAATLVLARVSDTKNMEFASVYLSRDLLAVPGGQASQDSRARLFSSLYTACTRAQHQLIVPEGFSDWISEAVKSRS